jgi:hypothetical protein
VNAARQQYEAAANAAWAKTMAFLGQHLRL